MIRAGKAGDVVERIKTALTSLPANDPLAAKLKVYQIATEATKGPAAGTNTITVTGTTFATGAAVQFQSAATCSTNPGTVVAGSVVNATSVTVQSPATSISVVVPALTAGVGYNLCAYTSSAVTGTQTVVTTTNPYTPHAALTSLGVTPTSGPATGSVVTVSDAATQFGSGTAVEFNTSSCPATYAATAGSTTVFAGTVAAFTPGTTSLSVTAPTVLDPPPAGDAPLRLLPHSPIEPAPPPGVRS